MAMVHVLGRADLDVEFAPDDAASLSSTQEALRVYQEKGFLVQSRRAGSDVMETVTTITPDTEEVTIIPRVAGGEC